MKRRIGPILHLRACDPKDWRFSVGLWVGRSATANTMAEVSEKLTEYKTSSAKNPSSGCAAAGAMPHASKPSSRALALT